MNEIIKKEKLAENTFLFQVKSPDIAKAAKPGQFIIAQLSEKGERIPLSIADFDSKSVTMIVYVAGKTTSDFAKLKKGDFVPHIAGPLGNPLEILSKSAVCLVAGGFGMAPIYPIARELKNAGSKVIIVAGAKSKGLLFWEDRLSKVADEMIITTDDGSKGLKGNVVDGLEAVLGRRQKVDMVFAVGPTPMMAAVSKATYQRARTIVSLNSIMLDGTGMCGSCRVKVAGETKFSCVDGPHFNGHAVDWDEISNRNKRYEEHEKHACRCGK